ncbi:Mut7-C ubiquitin/RNAse domain-containing protein [bacterium]|nr:Mut7-C ubiquitin/RNAse domain-containing protein [bacterium]
MQVFLRVYGELNDLLPKDKRQQTFPLSVHINTSAKDAIEQVGIPHPEVAFLLVNGDESYMGDRLHAEDRVAAYPQGYKIGISSLVPEIETPIRFTVDVHLGKLAGYLRLLGFDTWYESVDPGDDHLLEIALTENRILLSCDRKLLMNKRLKWGRVVRNRDPLDQLDEIVERYCLREQSKPFTRCMLCNELLRTASETEIYEQAPKDIIAKLSKNSESIKYCPQCEKIYWHGSHVDRMLEVIEGFGIKQ